MCDVLVVAPCTGNTLGKIANAITDTPVTMAVKSHLRIQRPVLLAIHSGIRVKSLTKEFGFFTQSSCDIGTKYTFLVFRSCYLF